MVGGRSLAIVRDNDGRLVREKWGDGGSRSSPHTSQTGSKLPTPAPAGYEISSERPSAVVIG
jgi:hypothetical protein